MGIDFFPDHIIIISPKIKEAFKMENKLLNKTKLDHLWLRDGVWYFSDFIRNFRKRVLKEYPDAEWTTRAKEPQDLSTIAQNLIYLFPGHVLKISKALSTVLADEEALTFLSQTREIVILDLACGAGTASIGVLDFILQLLKGKIIERKIPLRISVILNDIEPNCVKASQRHFGILGELLRNYNVPLTVGTIETCSASISNVLSFLKTQSSLRKFHFMVMAHPFDPILYHAEKALEIDPQCSDPIVHARPCDRPGILGDFYMNLGESADPYFSRALLVQENRYCPLLPICVPSSDLKVIRTCMEQEALRPDCPTKTLAVPFGYCAFKYAFNPKNLTRYPSPQPLPHMSEMQNFFQETPEI